MESGCSRRAAVIAVGVIANVVFRYFRYDAYKQYLSSYEVESGSEFQAAKDDKTCVPGMVLVAENDTLKLYTNTETTEIAVYEKESGNITYSNPVGRDSDAIASGKCGRTERNTDTYLLQCGKEQCYDEQL